jgi:sulfate permease, SulP family
VTVVVDLTMAVQAGLVLACLFYITRISGLTRVEQIEPVEPGVEAYRISGSLFFGTVSKMDLERDAGATDGPCVALGPCCRGGHR